MFTAIAKVVVDLPLEEAFDYAVPEPYRPVIRPGMRVLVKFVHRRVVGIVTGLAAKSSFPRLNPVLALLDEDPVFTPEILAFSEDFALRFGCSQGEALHAFLPIYLRGPKKLIGHREGEGRVSATASRGSSCVTLLFDRGQNRRWDVLTPRIRDVLSRGRGVLCLVPDARTLEDVLPRISALVDPEGMTVLRQGTPKEEFDRWARLYCGKARLAAGCISAVFAPVRDLGLVVMIDEESPSYKHDQSPFYHARDTVLLRAGEEGADVVLVSSAPSVETWKAVYDGKIACEVLKAALAPVRFLDLTNFKIKKDTFLSPRLRHHIECALKEDKKVLLYIQAARGTAGVCDEVKKAFPHAGVLGYDRSSVSPPERFDILVGTQSVLRHRSALRVDMSAVLDIDWEFHKSDYKAGHAVFALVQHLRQMTAEFVLLQTRHVGHKGLHTLAEDDPAKFYRHELAMRKEMYLPPYQHLVAIVVRSADPQLACLEAKRLYDTMNASLPKGVEAHEPQQDRAAIVRGKFRYCLMVQGKGLKTLMGFVKERVHSFRRKKDVVITVNVDP